ncbi:602_t:CDS:2 [Funneliformis geosporum]|uniref:602_t:CDS:1 n=1 Tax=Funneliformis geosporum TaxID=1117311 RepID=A0A9W4SUC2_9GLOM|nr:602_t:CDS:2 [Funneliformis geosporum]
MSFSGPSHSAAHANAQGGNKASNNLYCYGCKKNKPLHSFSQTQIDKSFSRGKKKHHIICKQCTPQQNNSLTCMLCTRTMALDNFSKAQRRNAEKARCLKCMKKREEEDIDDSEPDDDDSDELHHDTWDDIL